jgi:hypothetical protein
MDAKITPEELAAELQGDIEALVKKVCQSINVARVGHIIDDSEEPVRDAHAEFRQKAYQRALDLLQSKAAQEAFSPSQDSAEPDVEE